MIIDKLANAGRYSSLGPRWKAAFDFLLNSDLGAIADGRYELDGDRLFVLVFRYTSQVREAGTWEAHRRYADLQYIVHGEECMGVTLEGRLTAKPYDAARDCLFLTGDCSDIITVRAGEFVVFWPGEAHMPNLAVDAPAPVMKVVLKIACD
ncbi:MAG TPA: YhcH/YjgK/YiaL family protein [Candidatus Hydrogenedentes bacterium]|nr:YhcH/YjgK/YiaL family protein [Candidatus Hydrogenedentota bacterium]HRK33641.1 YhcH/YjgK/YiaL family protein [Candidatus Hydrogenedentota bacterium]